MYICQYSVRKFYLVKKEIVDNNVIIINNVFVINRNQKKYLGGGNGIKAFLVLLLFIKIVKNFGYFNSMGIS